MATTGIDLHRQGKAGTLTDAEVAAGAAIALSKLAEAVVQADGGQAFTGDQSFGGHRATNGADPTAAQDFATKAYVDAMAQGLDVKASVRAATTANITLSGAQTIDGVSVIAGDRVLVKNQTTGADNGIYVAAAGAWARATDADVSAEVTTGLYTFVEEGTANAGKQYALTTAMPITLGTTALTFTQFAAPTTYTAGDGLTLTGADFSVNVSSTGGLEIISDNLKVKLDGTSLSVGSSGLKVNPGKFITREAPSGTVDGSNTAFVLAATPIAGSESVFLNGLLQEPGAGNDYTISGATITYLTAPLAGDRIRVSYLIA